MFTIYCTEFFLHTVNIIPNTNPPQPDNILGEWFADCIVDKKLTYTILTNYNTLLPIVCPLTDGLNLPALQSALRTTLSSYGTPMNFITPELETMNEVSFCGISDLKMPIVVREYRDFCYQYSRKNIKDTETVLADLNLALLQFCLKKNSPDMTICVAIKLLKERFLSGANDGSKQNSQDSNAPLHIKNDFESGLPDDYLDDDPSQWIGYFQHPASSKAHKEICNIILTESSQGNPLDVIARKLLNVSPQAGHHLAWILLNEKDRQIFYMAVIILTNAANGTIEPELSDRLKLVSQPLLLDIFNNLRVPDNRKIMVVNVLLAMGSISPEDGLDKLNDFDRVANAISDSNAKIPPTPREAAQLLQSAGLPLWDDEANAGNSWQETLKTSKRFGNTTHELRALMLCTAAMAAVKRNRQLPKEFKTELSSLASSNCPGVLWQYEAFAALPVTKALGKIVSTAAGEMRSRGVQPAKTFQSEFSHAYLGIFDSDGNRQVILFFNRPDNGKDAFRFMISNQTGITSTDTCYEDTSEIEQSVQEQQEYGMPSALCGFEIIQEVIADALKRNIKSDTPIPPNAFLALQYLGDKLLEPTYRTPDISAYKLDMIERKPDMADGSDELMENRSYGCFGFFTDECYAFVKKHFNMRDDKVSFGDMFAFVDNACIHEKDRMLYWLASNMEVEALAERANNPENQLAARTYIAVSEMVTEFNRIHYIRKSGFTSFIEITNNLVAGCLNHRQAANRVC